MRDAVLLASSVLGTALLTTALCALPYALAWAAFALVASG